ncbi:MAG: hypothetical protein AAGC71_02155 [Pseudomonadota bacterium]
MQKEQKVQRTANNSVESKLGGLLLITGSLLTVICISLEVSVEWWSFWYEIQRTDYEAGAFLYEHWAVMSPIWALSLLGNVLLATASLLLLKNTGSGNYGAVSIGWAIYFLGTLALALSFAVSVGGYHPALAVINEQPALFETIRGVALFLFNLGMPTLFIPLAVLFQQGFARDGFVPRYLAIVAGVLIVAVLLLTVVGWTSSAAFAVVVILATALLGIAYSRPIFASRDVMPVACAWPVADAES